MNWEGKVDECVENKSEECKSVWINYCCLCYGEEVLKDKTITSLQINRTLKRQLCCFFCYGKELLRTVKIKYISFLYVFRQIGSSPSSYCFTTTISFFQVGRTRKAASLGLHSSISCVSTATKCITSYWHCKHMSSVR